MAEPIHESNDPVIRGVVEQLRRPIDLGPSVDRRVLAELRGSPSAATPRRGVGHAVLIGGLALAAGLAAVMLVPSPSAPTPATVAAGDGLTAVRFSISAEVASRVSVVGDFNDWNPAGTPLHRAAGGQWSVTLPLTPGRYRFSFLLDGETWIPDPHLPRVPDPDFGAPTSVITVEPAAL
jgi:hypothetical protein